ncbi:MULTISPECIES: preprotein translocase subunit YajC [Nitratiruptor]|uniref:Sec translocon accessory complex subunit YajC n=1 Tax=Nitratiruptor tergarcus DSM 16512 TaxID=1069081 RepID=A0A1W1WRC2_9BACT|nr:MULTISPECIES: preprotein translocase subunit YajC [Nitratiruptor]BCD62748.1 preprotein translocase subunit YajC [Nitratiruptor sp. YY08-13]BCD66684.1 preprotein translocase subunit YajC [Nitratiruptor sp. YY08-26]SMC08273.1 protein translocase subunit yajC [Nitratiruptor tergarcus DSM 16512]
MQGQGASILGSLLPLIIIFAVFYFLIIRPQQQQAKKHKEMVNNLKKGDKIVTTGGIIAEVVKNDENFIKARISDNTEVKLDKNYIAKKLES